MTGEDFQAVILTLSEHLGSADPIELSPEEVQALLGGFQQMAANIGQSVEIIEQLEADLAEARQKRKFWTPEGNN